MRAKRTSDIATITNHVHELRLGEMRADEIQHGDVFRRFLGPAGPAACRGVGSEKTVYELCERGARLLHLDNSLGRQIELERNFGDGEPMGLADEKKVALGTATKIGVRIQYHPKERRPATPAAADQNRSSRRKVLPVSPIPGMHLMDIKRARLPWENAASIAW